MLSYIHIVFWIIKKIKLCIIYGGLSTEHEVSINSAKSVIDNLDKDKYDIYKIYIDKKGETYKKKLNVSKIYAPNGLEIKKVITYDNKTESVSTILNTRRPFTRVFYAKDEEDAHKMLVKWFADRQLHENKAKTVITELKSDGGSVYEVK